MESKRNRKAIQDMSILIDIGAQIAILVKRKKEAH